MADLPFEVAVEKRMCSELRCQRPNCARLAQRRVYRRGKPGGAEPALWQRLVCVEDVPWAISQAETVDVGIGPSGGAA